VITKQVVSCVVHMVSGKTFNLDIDLDDKSPDPRHAVVNFMFDRPYFWDGETCIQRNNIEAIDVLQLKEVEYDPSISKSIGGATKRVPEAVQGLPQNAEEMLA